MYGNLMRTLIVGCALALSVTASAADRWQIADSKLDALDELLAQHPDEFGGLTVDPKTQRVLVRVIANEDRALVRQWLRDLPRDAASADDPQWTIVLKPVVRSTRRLETIRAALMEQEPWATLIKPVFAQIHVDISRNVVALGLTSITPELHTAVRNAFGSAVELYITEPMRYFSRLVASEGGTLAGGASIFLPIPGTTVKARCSSGWPIKGSIAMTSLWKGFTTAGHCATEVGIGQPADILDINGVYLGSLIGLRAASYSITSLGVNWSQDTDALVFFDFNLTGPVRAEPRVYIGNSSSNSRRYVVGSRTVRQGDSVCMSGGLTGENCNATVSSVNVTQQVLIGSSGFVVGFPVSGVYQATSTNGSTIAQPGDSGGPVYIKRLLGGQYVIYAVGSIEGGTTTVTTFMPLNKVIPNNYALWTASCSVNIFGSLSCTF